VFDAQIEGAWGGKVIEWGKGGGEGANAGGVRLRGWEGYGEGDERGAMRGRIGEAGGWGR